MKEKKTFLTIDEIMKAYRKGEIPKFGYPDYVKYLDVDDCEFPCAYTYLIWAIFGGRSIDPNQELKLFSSSEVNKALMHLTFREAKVIVLRYGLSDGKQGTLAEVGMALDITRERIRQIEAKALRKLRHPQRTKKTRTLKFADIMQYDITEEERKELECLEKDILNSNLVLGGAATDAKFDMSRLELVKKICKIQRGEISVSEETPDETPIEKFDLSVRTYNCLKRAGIDTLGEIRSNVDELDKIRNLGTRGVEEVLQLLNNPAEYVARVQKSEESCVTIEDVIDLYDNYYKTLDEVDYIADCDDFDDFDDEQL